MSGGNRGQKVPFGTMLRAARLRFVYVDRWNAFMRTTDHGDKFLVELRPNDVKQLKGGEGVKHRVVDDAESLIRLSPVLSAIEEIDRAFDLILDDCGCEVARSSS
jgi:hypothetical protein